MEPPFTDLYFGKSDSLNEANDDREEFVRSYVDLNNTLFDVVSGEKFLVLGPKGTGKSALSMFLQLTEANGTHLALGRDASSLPLAEVPRLQTGQAAGPERTVVAWKFILLCNYLELLLRDQGCSLQRNPEVMRVARLLRNFGFMGDASGRALLKASSTTVTIPIPKLGNLYKRESQDALNIYNLIPYLEGWAAEATSSLRHVLIIDGLDSIFLNDEKYDESLSSLVQAAYGLNQKLRSATSSGSVVLLLRNDVFSRIALSLPDSQKMRDDLSASLDWRVLSGKAGARAPLIQLVNAKAAKALDIPHVDVLSYFPQNIEVGGRGRSATKSMPILPYLLNLTRHTPRDMLRLFEEIRRVQASGMYDYRRGLLSRDAIREGVLQYCTKYFVGAIRNEFAGYEGGASRAETAISALKALGKQTFTRGEFRAALADLDGAQSPPDTDRLLTLLFYAGAIGNSVVSGNETYLQFYHRRDEAEIYLRGNFVLHNALIHAWGMHRSGPGPHELDA